MTLRALMTEAGENPFSLSKKIGVPQPTLHRILAGTTVEPKRKTLDRIAKHFKVSVESLMKDGKTATTTTPRPAEPTLAPDAAELLANYQKLLKLDPKAAARWAAEIRVIAAQLELEQLKSGL